MNSDLKNKIYLGLFGVSGPVAKALALWFGMDGPTVEIILNILMIVTPSIAAWAAAMAARIENKVLQAKLMKPAEQAQLASALSDSTIAHAAASPTRPDITAVVIDERTNDPALRQAMTDPNQPAIVKQSQVEIR